MAMRKMKTSTKTMAIRKKAKRPEQEKQETALKLEKQKP